ncbi:MAG: hypothetical protein K0S31_2715 [Sphingobacterium multivorum]|jgi:hypothetical protein|nr:hypothetical protein [Sphingobacterium multivorum]
MSKYLYLAIAFAAVAATSCDNRTKSSEKEQKVDTTVNQNGLPLDNIHRSRGKDTTKNKAGTAQEAVPLDNLDRTKAED